MIMSDVTIDARQLKRLDRGLAKSGRDFKKGTKSLLKKIGTVVQGQAVKNAPQKTGDLERSITTDIGKDYVSIGVPSNSAGGRYAEKMENWTGDFGKRTEQKGQQAGAHYIERAAETTAKEIDNMIDDVLNEAGF